MRKIIEFVLTLTMLLGFGLAVQALPEPQPDNIYIMVDANVLDGYGIFYLPVSVPFSDDESVLDITARWFGQHVTINGDFLTGFATPAAELAASDYAPFSGWMLTINNEMTMLGAAAEFPQHGDVIRWEFSLDFGVDIGFEGWDGTPPAFDRADKSELIRAYTAICPICAGVWRAHDAMNNLTATQEQVDEAIIGLLLCFCNDRYVLQNRLAIVGIVLLSLISGFAIFRFVRILAGM
ncbi:MAG: DUF4430 domain-containing protein [Oscillospiraceae bacterium]|nr:DUF4430 domain-containing protein [Oscillospiraceae bacterium]